MLPPHSVAPRGQSLSSRGAPALQTALVVLSQHKVGIQSDQCRGYPPPRRGQSYRPCSQGVPCRSIWCFPLESLLFVSSRRVSRPPRLRDRLPRLGRSLRTSKTFPNHFGIKSKVLTHLPLTWIGGEAAIQPP